MLESEHEDLYALLITARDVLDMMIERFKFLSHEDFVMEIDARLMSVKWELARGTSYSAWHEGAKEALELAERAIKNER